MCSFTTLRKGMWVNNYMKGKIFFCPREKKRSHETEQNYGNKFAFFLLSGHEAFFCIAPPHTQKPFPAEWRILVGLSVDHVSCTVKTINNAFLAKKGNAFQYCNLNCKIYLFFSKNNSKLSHWKHFDFFSLSLCNREMQVSKHGVVSWIFCALKIHYVEILTPSSSKYGFICVFTKVIKVKSAYEGRS